MTRKLFNMCAALVWTATLMAQNIAVVNGNNTDLYRTLAEAIEGAAPNSVIYLPGGGFPISDEIKITKKLTIIGIGHKSNNDNVDGVTTINGNLFFNEGSSASAVMGIFLTGNLYIANDEKKIDNILIRWNNINEVQVQNKTCEGMVVNQNYIRSGAYFHGAGGEFTNNIVNTIEDLDNGIIAYNVIPNFSNNYAIKLCDQCAINHNVIMKWIAYPHYGASCTAFGNMLRWDWGDDPINVSEAESWAEVFENPAGIDPNSSYHFKGEYKQYEHKCGIYAGDGFNDKQLAPVPYIVAKRIDEQTDASGKLNIRVRVKAGE